MPKVPPYISKWDAACLAKYILKHWRPEYTFKSAMEVMEMGNTNMSIPVLCSYGDQEHAGPNMPPEIISELKRRASLPS